MVEHPVLTITIARFCASTSKAYSVSQLITPINITTQEGFPSSMPHIVDATVLYGPSEAASDYCIVTYVVTDQTGQTLLIDPSERSMIVSNLNKGDKIRIFGADDDPSFSIDLENVPKSLFSSSHVPRFVLYVSEYTLIVKK